MKTERKKIGDAGEDLALEFLAGRGMMLMERNWRYHHLEVDLIMLADDGVHIVEVKTRTPPVLMEPSECVDWRKRRFLKNAASAFISGRKIEADTHFDIVSVILKGDGRSIEYVPDAFTTLD